MPDDAPADTTTAPPAPELLPPTTTLMAPPRPPAATPLDTASHPEFPAAVVPLLSSTDPLTPLDTALADDIVTDPVLDDALPPLTIDTLPPV